MKKVTRTVTCTHLRKEGKDTYVYPLMKTVDFAEAVSLGYEIIGEDDVSFSVNESDFILYACEQKIGKEEVHVDSWNMYKSYTE